MPDIVDNIEKFLKKYDLKGTVLVGFSGGYDSICLLDILTKLAPKYDLNLVAIHLNHNWRGEESLNDANRAKKFAESKNIEFYQETLPSDIPHTETAAREARYKFFENCAKKFNSKYVITAHNTDDNIETVLYRIIKGTGLKGLCGIYEHRGIYYRPLLKISRLEIEKYCQNNNLIPNVDSSNSDTKYKRNFIRKEILPLFSSVNEDYKKSLLTLIDNANSDNDIIEEYILKTIKKIHRHDKISTEKFLKLSDSLQLRIIYNVLSAVLPEYDKNKVAEILEFIRDNSQSKSGKTKSLTTDLWFFVNKKYLEIVTIKPEILEEISITAEGTYRIGQFLFTIEKTNEIPNSFPKDTEFISYVNLEDFSENLTLRTRQPGDLINPLGVCGTQKLKKYLNSKGIPKHERESVILLAHKNEILWVAGYGLSNKIKADSKVTHKITLEKENNYGN